MTDEQLRSRILEKLQGYALADERNEPARIRAGTRLPDREVNSLALDLNTTDTLPVHLEMRRLERLGVVISGSLNALRDRDGGYSPFHSWPYFTITPFGRTYLEATEKGIDPGDPRGFVDRVRKAMPSLPNVAVTYLSEASRSYTAGLYLGTTVLLGVAAEALLEHLYAALLGGLPEPNRTSFRDRLQREKRSAERRYAAFVAELRLHNATLGPETMDRAERILDPLVKLMKTNRDDVAHQRATRVNENTAFAELASFPALAEAAAELEAAFSRLLLPLSTPGT